MKKYLSYLIVSLLFISSTALAQTRDIRGVVSDANGPVPGATVMEVGMPSNGTATDIDGNFRLVLRGNSNKIQVKSIGYKTREVNVQNMTNVNVNLETDAQGLEEVVVIGYGEQKKVTMTGAVSVVSGVEIRENPSASMQNALVGKMPGFFTQQQSGRPGADAAQMYIRGVSSPNDNNAPLILVDDIEFSVDQFQRLDPNEVESVSILKDASTTAVYGVKGANGVILVTTRRGAIGRPKISVRTEYSLQQPAMFPEFLGSYESALLHNQARLNDATLTASRTGNPLNYTPAFSDEAVEAFRTGSNPYVYPDVDWREVLFRKWSNQSRSNLDVSGGTERVKYFVSMGYLDQGGMLKNFGENVGVNNSYYHRRVNYRSNLDVQVNKNLNMRVDLYGNIGEVNNPEMPGTQWGYNDPFYEYSSYLSLSPYAHPAYNPDGSIGYRLNLHPGRYQGPNSIIARLTYGGYGRVNENNMNLVASATQKLGFITQGLSAKGLLSYASEYGYRRSMTRGTFPSYIWDPVTDTYTSYPNNVYRAQRFFDDYQARGTTRVLNYQFHLNYDRTFGNHHVYGLALLNHRVDTRSRGGTAAALSYRPVNFRGYTGRLGYDFKDKYLFQFNAGLNGSPFFSGGNQFGFFPAVSAGWNISEEPFFKDNINFVDFLKVRTSYGLVGNDLMGGQYGYYYLQEYGNSGSASFGTVHNHFGGIHEGRLPNMDVVWEKEKKFDVGLEFKFFKSRLSANLDYFRNERFNILTTRDGNFGTVSDVFGVGSPPANLSRVENKGYEVELIWRDNIGTDFGYNIRAMYSYANNKILFMDEPNPAEPYQRRTGNNINTPFVYKWSGEFYASEEDILASPTHAGARPGDLKYVDLNNDGVINQNDRTYIGAPANIPPATFAVEGGVSYKGFSIKTMFQGSRGFVSGGAAENIQFLGSNMQEIHKHAWTPELGNNAQYPVLTENMGISMPRGETMSTFWLVPADFIRLRNAEISYTIPKSIVDRVRMQSIRVYANGNNLLTWSKLQDRYQLDPEVLAGRDRITYPPQRIINFGLSVGF
ncbi:SusC/RagA family TonB-linked outer membrane protein [Botryobacter ruber]|uniref:SusC/RagA family TonB-linked outer membrane protein n=1 Tax=Botryobacter ruber TaxID=2171629 RepID=UPI000E0A0169|nr:TonB-dependent receptor [Botryobacter ruber]